MLNGYFVDDREQDAYIADRLSSEGDSGIHVSFLPADKPLEAMADFIINLHPDFLALDYRLDEAQVDGQHPIHYKAGPLAQQLRDRASITPASDFPIILVSNEDRIKNFYEPDLTSHDLFDLIYSKQNVVKFEEDLKTKVLDLSLGYKKLIELLGQNDLIAKVLDSSKDENPELVNQEFRRWEQYSAPHQIARQILRYIINKNGILCNSDFVLALLGVSVDSEDKDKIFEYLDQNGCRYSGTFSTGWPRWWKHKVLNVVSKLCQTDIGNLNAYERVQCFNEALGNKLTPAMSRWTNSEDFYPSFTCISCHYPTEKKHSLLVYGTAPSFVSRERVCWFCVASGIYQENNIEIDDSEEYIKEKLESGEISQEG